jgi:hypothetical protein
MFFTGYTYPLQKNNSDDECPPTEPSAAPPVDNIIPQIERWQKLHDVSFRIHKNRSTLEVHFNGRHSLFWYDASAEDIRTTLYDLVYT